VKRLLWNALSVALLATLGGTALAQTGASPQSSPPSKTAQQSGGQKAAPKTGARKTGAAANSAMTNRDVIRLVKAKIADDIIAAKIKQSKTKFDTSVEGLVALKEVGVSDGLISVIVNASEASSQPAPGGASASPTAAKPGSLPASNGSKEVVATDASRASKSSPEPKPVVITQAPANYGMYIVSDGQLKPLGRIETKVQVSKFRSLLKSVVPGPLVRQKVDINIPGAHSTNRHETLRPTFYAYFPPSRDVSKFKLLQCKITGQNFDQRTLANASILFSTEQNQDEVLVDIGPTSVKDLYRIFPREDLPSGEFGFVEGNTGSKSASNIEILDVYDFGIDRKEEKLALKDYLDTLPTANAGDIAFLSWTKEDCQKIVVDREGKIGITGSLLGWFKRQYASLDVYWADPEFARAFARLEMLDRNLTPEEATKLCSLLLSQGGNQYYILVSIGGKVGSGRLIGANEGERLMRPFDASLSNKKSKDVVPARHLEFVGGYAGVWKVTFDRDSIKGPLLSADAQELVFEARLNQNLDFKATFPMAEIIPAVSAEKVENAKPTNAQ
jgi:cell division septation protein DedD